MLLPWYFHLISVLYYLNKVISIVFLINILETFINYSFYLFTILLSVGRTTRVLPNFINALNKFKIVVNERETNKIK